MPTRRVAIATCADLPRGDEDADLLGTALASRGVAASWQVWTDPSVDWSAFDLVIVRSTWDYTAARDRFLAWAQGVPRLANPIDVLAWNSDKTYLRELSDAGVPTITTYWAPPGDPVVLPAADIVVKPSIGAGSKGVGRFDATRVQARDAARSHAAALHDAGRMVMVQAYLADVDGDGETALIYVDGRFSHAVRKSAMLPRDTVNALDAGFSGSLFVQERISLRGASDAELDLGAHVLRVVSKLVRPDLLYARVDLLPTPDGPVVIEVELVEPSLFLRYRVGAADRLADAVAARLGADEAMQRRTIRPSR